MPRSWTARTGNRRFRLLRGLRDYTKVPYKTRSLRETLRPLTRPGRAQTVARAQVLAVSLRRLHADVLPGHLAIHREAAHEFVLGIGHAFKHVASPREESSRTRDRHLCCFCVWIRVCACGQPDGAGPRSCQLALYLRRVLCGVDVLARQSHNNCCSKRHCPGRKPPKRAVNCPACPYKKRRREKILCGKR
jgi:hypothetical protein